MAFSGRLNLKIDAKGRFRLPSSFASVLEGSGKDSENTNLIVTNSIYKGERCLDVYTESEWQKLNQKMSNLPSFDSRVQAFQRFYLASAHTVQLDGQGRLLTPPVLREFAALSSQIVIIGMGDKFEIWDESTWSKVFGDITENYDEILQAVSQLSQQEEES